MDYIYYGTIIEVEAMQKNQYNRLLMYTKMFQTFPGDTVQCDVRSGEKYFIKLFFDKESKWEQKIYHKLKEWERRHPIMGIVLCTVLGGILISLVAGVILEAILISM